MGSIKGRVGRHLHANLHQCQNWSADQQTVMNLLNQIPSKQGGAGGNLTDRIVSGIIGDILWGSILIFEEQHSPANRRGYVDPNGPLLKKMENLAAAASTAPAISPRITAPTAKPAESPLQILLRNLLDDSREIKADPFWSIHRASFQPLITMARRHINNLIELKLTQLPFPVELFGRAYVLPKKEFLQHSPTAGNILFGGDGPLEVYDLDKHDGTKAPDLPEMSYGHPVDIDNNIYTTHLAALLLFRSGGVFRLGPYQWQRIGNLEPREYDKPGSTKAFTWP